MYHIWIIINPNLCPSIARKKRKCALRDKGINYSRLKMQQSSSLKSQLQKSTPMEMSRTPLSQICLNSINQRDQCYGLLKSNEASSSTSHTQPSSIPEDTRKMRFINPTSLGINLMNRYGTIYEDEPNKIVDKCKENLLHYSSSKSYSHHLLHTNNEDDDNSDIDMEGIHLFFYYCIK
ncbi:unnamed protein product [Lupinus luteus]|uniref:Uncharacterized protein n=1 Tax=Lupinus luteus TaxID=3873 RepID=A0AAV1WBQ0_LUPLU